MVQRCEVAVVGLGGVGSATLAHLAQQGVRALGLEQFDPQRLGSSSRGRTRMIRLAYFEHPDYVPLCRASFRFWEQLQEQSGTRLLVLTGLLQVGEPDSEVIQGVRRSAQQHRLSVEQLDREEIHRRWPGFRVPEGCLGLYETQAGFLYVERCVQTMIRQALAHEAQVLWKTQVKSWQVRSGQVVLHTTAGTVEAEQVVFCAGAWLQQLVPQWAARVRVVRKPQYWFSAPGELYGHHRGFPGFLFQLPQGVFYGFPQENAVWGLKVAQHSHGRQLPSAQQQFDHLDPDDLSSVVQFVRQCLPEVGRHLRAHVPCMYTLSPDGHFLLGQVPQAQGRVWVIGGLSGHGFKFVGVLAQAVAQLALKQKTHLPVGFLSPRRLGPLSG